MHHGVRIHDSALVAAATLTARYLPDRHLPDKAIDAIDEAASMVRLALDSRPNELDRARPADPPTRDRAGGAAAARRIRRAGTGSNSSRRSSSNLKERETALGARWKHEREQVGKVREIRAQLDRAKAEEAKAEQAGDLETTARLRYGTIPELQTLARHPQ